MNKITFRRYIYQILFCTVPLVAVFTQNLIFDALLFLETIFLLFCAITILTTKTPLGKTLLNPFFVNFTWALAIFALFYFQYWGAGAVWLLANVLGELRSRKTI